MLISMSTETIHFAETAEPPTGISLKGKGLPRKAESGRSPVVSIDFVEATGRMPSRAERDMRKKADIMSTASECEAGACDCKCNCADCFCNGKSGHDVGGLDFESNVFQAGPGSAEARLSQEGTDGYPAAFSWRDPGFDEHVDNRFGGFDMTKDGFQHSESDECEPLRRSVILRDLATFNRTATSTSLANEGTSGVASVASSGFLPRRAETVQNLLDFVGSWDEASSSPGCHFTGQPPWLSAPACGNVGYPAGIREEDMK